MLHAHSDFTGDDASGFCMGCGSLGQVGDPCHNTVCSRFELHYVPSEDPGIDPQRNDPLLGRLVDEFLIVQLIGVGGFGRVYRGLHGRGFQQEAAIKFLKLPDEERLRALMPERFENEAHVLEALRHPNIVGLVGHRIEGDRPYIAMEYLRSAVTLREDIIQRLRNRMWYHPEQVRGILMQTLDALQAAHEQGIVHRDVKPENIMLQYVDSHVPRVKLLDFGTAKFVALEGGVTSLALGSPSYMAPEQFELENIGTWTDVYASAVVAFELFAERKPFPGEDDRAILKYKFDPAFDPFTGARLAPEVVSILRRAMADEPSYRFRNAGEFRSALAHVLDRPGFGLAFERDIDDSDAEDTTVATYDATTRRFQTKSGRIPTPTPYSLEGEDLCISDTLPPVEESAPRFEVPIGAYGPGPELSIARRLVPDRNVWRAITLMLALILLTMIWSMDRRDGGDRRDFQPQQTAATTPLPTPPARLAAAAAFASHTCVGRDDGALACWGEPRLLGAPPTAHDSGPWRALSSPAVDIAVLGEDSQSSACLLLADGNVRCWGYNADGRLGYGHDRPVAFEEIAGSSGFHNVPTGRPGVSLASSPQNASTCVVLDTGAVRCWGSASKKRDAAEAAGHDVLRLDEPARDIVGYDEGFCARSSAGSVTCWEASEDPTFTEIELDRPAMEITAGRSHVCALDEDGGVWCWGSNDRGQLGFDPTKEPITRPVLVALGETARAVTAGNAHSCALLPQGTVKCWGDNTYGQLGLGARTKSITAKDTEYVLLGEPADVIFAGGDHTCAVLQSGTMSCWGRDDDGQLDGGVRPDEGPSVASRAL